VNTSEVRSDPQATGRAFMDEESRGGIEQTESTTKSTKVTKVNVIFVVFASFVVSFGLFVY
jgi:hypothetical protein